jgi:hypothetical protein
MQRAPAGQTVLLAALVVLGTDACDGGREQHARPLPSQGDARVGGAVISTVDGLAITVGEVQELVTAGLARDEALRRLQAERLLMLEAERRATGGDPAVAWVTRQAQVQALLESVTGTVSIGDEDIAEAYEKARARFEVPERRVVVHVLAVLPDQANASADAAARAFASSMIGQLERAPDVAAFLASQRGKKTAEFEVRAESLPPLSLDSNIVPEFLEATFGLREPGVVRQPVKTRFGWHAIRLLEIQPASITPYAEAAAQLRAELTLARKKELVETLIGSLRKQHRVEMSDGLRETLAKIEF